ncbi:MAG: hypothetical protein AAF556_02685 [Pseudomonadota bacterium]
MTLSSITLVPPPVTGWLDGIADRPVKHAGHTTIPVGSHYALIWDDPHQGDIQAQGNRLLAVMDRARVLPARPQQFMQDEADFAARYKQCENRVTHSLEAIGDCVQYSLTLHLPRSFKLKSSSSLRVKHKQRRYLRTAIMANAALLRPFMEEVRPIMVDVLGPQLSAADKLCIHLLTRHAQAGQILQSAMTDYLADHPSALIGPLPSFSFATL